MKAPSLPTTAFSGIDTEIVRAMRAAAEHPTVPGVKAIQAMVWNTPPNTDALAEMEA